MKLILIFLSLSFFQSCRGQNELETESLHVDALQYLSIEIDEFYNRFGDKLFGDSIFIEENEFLDNIPQRLDGRDLVILTEDNTKLIYKHYRVNIPHIRVRPLEALSDGTVRLCFVPYIGSLDSDGQIFLELSDWTYVYYKFDCDTGEWKYIKTESGGI